MSREELLVLRKTLTDYLDKGFIRVSHSSAVAPVLFAKKPGGGLRFCVDYRGLNRLTKKDRYPLPLIHETLRNISKAKWFTKLDVIAAFHRLRINEGDEWMTAFRTRYGLFEWMVTPFGLANAPSTFQKYINWALRDYLDEFCSAYMDDILIYTDGTKEEHEKQVTLVLQRMIDAGLQIDIKKCEFSVKSTKYLGFIVEAEKGIRMDPDKVRAIMVWKAPKSVKGVQSFLGFANFYRRFIKNFSDIVMPLVNVTRKDQTFKWDTEQNAAFEKLKKIFTTAPVLAQFDPERETIVETDSSGWCVGGALMQFDDEGLLRPCAFFSKKNSPAECNYEIYDKEMLAIIKCLKEWSGDLRSVKSFQIRSDHKNLQYFMTARHLTERQMRWSLELSKYNFTIAYYPGALNSRADALTRREQDMPSSKQDERIQYRHMQLLKPEKIRGVSNGTIIASPVTVAPVVTRAQHQIIQDAVEQAEATRLFQQDVQEEGNEAQNRNESVIEANDPARNLVEQELFRPDNSADHEPGEPETAGEPQSNELEILWHTALEQDDIYRTISKALQDGLRKWPKEVKDVGVSISECSLSEQGTVLFRGRRWVPDSEELRNKIIQQTHDSMVCGHPGRETTAAIVGRSFFWPGYSLQVRRFVWNCDSCGRNKAWRTRRAGYLKPLPVPGRLWQELSIDFMVELPDSEGNTNIVVVTDRLSKGVIVAGLKDTKAETVASWFIRNVYRHHGLPRAIVSDRGKQSVGDLWKRICQILKITRRLSTAYHPKTDGATERMNTTIQEYLRAFVDFAQDDWSQSLYIAELAINNRDAASTGVSPFFLMHGYHVEPLGVVQPR